MWLRALAFSTVLPLVFGGNHASSDKAKKTDLEAMQGTWKIIHLEYPGVVREDSDGTLKVEKNVWTLNLRLGDREISTRAASLVRRARLCLKRRQDQRLRY